MSGSVTTLVHLDSALQHFKHHGLNESTRKSYSVGAKQFLLFNSMHNIPKSYQGLPIISEPMLMYFVTHCAHELKLSYACIKVYLFGIRNMYIENGEPNPLCTPNGGQLPQLDLVLKGIKKLSQGRLHRLPITQDILLAICKQLSQGCFGLYTDSLLKAFCCMCFFGFFRAGELLCQTNAFDPHYHLTIGDVRVQNHQNESCVCVFLKRCKTDPFGQGTEVFLFKTNNSLCPVTAAIDLINLHSAKGAVLSDPFFKLEDNMPLTKSKMVGMLQTVIQKAGFNPAPYTAHSFRKGAASECHIKKVEDSVIQFLGRWRSSCYVRYITPNKSTLRDAQMLLAE